MEAKEEFTIEGCIAMSWIIGCIKHFGGHLKNCSLHVGWVDMTTGQSVDEKEILKHAGVLDW